MTIEPAMDKTKLKPVLSQPQPEFHLPYILSYAHVSPSVNGPFEDFATHLCLPSYVDKKGSFFATIPFYTVPRLLYLIVEKRKEVATSFPRYMNLKRR